VNGVTVDQLDEPVAPDRLPSHPRDDRYPRHTANHPLDVEQFLSGPGDEQRIAGRRRGERRVTAVAQASEVLPTPPLPVKNNSRVG